MRTWSFDGFSYILLQSGVDRDNFRLKISGIINKFASSTVTECKVDIQPLNRMHLYALNGTGPIVYVYIFSIIALIVLLIACINFMNLSTAKSSIRMEEIGVRKVFGAKRNNLIIQFLSESIMLSFIALIFAIILVFLLLPGFNNITSKQIEFNLTRDFSMLIWLLVVTLLTGLLSGSYPSFYLSSFKPVEVLKGKKQKGIKNDIFRKTLIVSQFTAAIVLLISTITIYGQLSFIRSKDLGFSKEHIITVRMNGDIREKYSSIKEKLLKNTNILNITAASSLPLNINNISGFYWEGSNPEKFVDLNFVCVDYDYFETFKMKMVKGRSFSRKYSADIQNYIINESAAELIGFEEPVGKMFAMWDTRGQVVGVVKDFHGTSLHNEIPPIVFLIYNNLPYSNMFVKLNSENMPQTIAVIRNTFKAFEPDFLFQYTFLDENFTGQYAGENRIGSLLTYFTLLAIFIGCLGLFGLSTFMVERRTKEIAIRKVLGSSISKIIGIISREFISLIILSNILAGFIAYYVMNKWLQNFAYKTNMGPGIFVSSAVIVLIIALVTVSFQAIKASTANPIDSLRNE
jgi:ABC-type antimicrobial peptide transport system permease subunit